jgi:hypothetical protein
MIINQQQTFPSVPGSNLVIWLKSTEGITLSQAPQPPGSGIFIDEWADQSAQSNDGVAAPIPNAPTFQAINPNLNNKPSVDFTASTPPTPTPPVLPGNTKMATPNNGFSGNNGLPKGFDLFIALSRPAYVSNFNIIFQYSNDTSWSQGFGILKSSDGSLRGFINDWNDITQRASISEDDLPENTGTILHFRYDPTLASDNILLETYAPITSIRPTVKISGTQSYTAAIDTSGAAIETNIANADSNFADFSGEFGEILFYNAPQNTIDTAQILNYLYIKFNIPIV